MISCVIPTFENRDMVAACLASACRQTGVDVEIIVTDDSRTDIIADLTRETAARHPNVRYEVGPRSGNPVDNWNHGLEHARHDLRVVLHQDETLLDPTYLNRAVRALARSKAPATVARTRVTGVTRPSRFGLVAPVARRLPRPAWWLPVVNWIGPTAAFVFRGPHRFDPSFVQLVDVEFYGRVLAGKRPILLGDECVGSLGHHPDQISARIDPIALARQELADLATRSPAAISPLQHRLARLAIRLRAGRRS